MRDHAFHLLLDLLHQLLLLQLRILLLLQLLINSHRQQLARCQLRVKPLLQKMAAALNENDPAPWEAVSPCVLYLSLESLSVHGSSFSGRCLGHAKFVIAVSAHSQTGFRCDRTECGYETSLASLHRQSLSSSRPNTCLRKTSENLRNALWEPCIGFRAYPLK